MMSVAGLDANDVVASFNYDCLLDSSMRDIARRKWDPRSGYAVAETGQTGTWMDHSGTGRFPIQGHRVLKLHGSLNWRVGTDGGLRLLRLPYARRQRDGDLCIVPPLWQKSFDRRPFREIWIAARRSLTATKALLLIGYSLPLTDQYTQALLRIDVQELDFLLLANPDSNARQRIKRVLRPALRPGTVIVELDTMEAVGRLLRGFQQ
jgi:hypothetical protein